MVDQGAKPKTPHRCLLPCLVVSAAPGPVGWAKHFLSPGVHYHQTVCFSGNDPGQHSSQPLLASDVPDAPHPDKGKWEKCFKNSLRVVTGSELISSTLATQSREWSSCSNKLPRTSYEGKWLSLAPMDNSTISTETCSLTFRRWWLWSRKSDSPYLEQYNLDLHNTRHTYPTLTCSFAPPPPNPHIL